MRTIVCGLSLALAAVAVPVAAQQRSALPLVEIPAVGAAHGGLVAVILSADGGWVTFDKVVANRFAAAGVPVVGWSSLDYYRTPRTQDEAAADLARVLRTHLPAGARAYLVGYSFGADVLPFLVNRLPADLRARVAGVALVGLSSYAVFHFQPGEWVGLLRGPRYATLPEVRRLGDLPLLCVYGSGDRDAICEGLGIPGARVVAVPSGHRFAGISPQVADLLVRAATAPAVAVRRVGERMGAAAGGADQPARVTLSRGGM
jgi:type IV secretory pathway VirJ component